MAMVIENPLQMAEYSVNGHLYVISLLQQAIVTQHDALMRATTRRDVHETSMAMLSLVFGVSAVAQRTEHIRCHTSDAQRAAKLWATTIFN